MSLRTPRRTKISRAHCHSEERRNGATKNLAAARLFAFAQSDNRKLFSR